MNAIATDLSPITAAPAPVQTKAESLSQTFVLQNRQGLHCRPAALLVKTLTSFDCRVTVEGNGAIANGRSIIGLMTLAAGFGTKLTFILTGPGARRAMNAIQCLFENNFSAAYLDGRPSRNT